MCAAAMTGPSLNVTRMCFLSQTTTVEWLNELPDLGIQACCEERRAGLFAWLQHAAKQLKRSVLALFYASQDPSVGWAPRVIAAFVLAYALSPMDLIPDFIPVFGILDDLILLPGMIWLVSFTSNSFNCCMRCVVHKQRTVVSLTWCICLAFLTQGRCITHMFPFF